MQFCCERQTILSGVVLIMFPPPFIDKVKTTEIDIYKTGRIDNCYWGFFFFNSTERLFGIPDIIFSNNVPRVKNPYPSEYILLYDQNLNKNYFPS